MKTILLTGSPTFLYKKPRKVSPYMAAIVRRHRFIILLIISLLLLLLFCWYFHWRENFIIKNTSILYISKNSNKAIEIYQPNKQYVSPMLEKSDNIEKLETEVLNIRESQVTEDFTSNVLHQTNEKIILDDEAYTTPTIRSPDIEFSTTFIDMNADETYSYLEDTSFVIPHVNKKVIKKAKRKMKKSSMQEHTENFPSVNAGNDKAKTDVNVLSFKNIADYLDLGINMFVRPNQEPPLLLGYDADVKSTLLLDTPGCKIPKMDPWDPTVRDLILLVDPYVCPGLPVFLKSNPGGSITLNETILKTYYNATTEDIVCHYQPIYRMHEEVKNRERSIMFGNPRPLEFEVPLHEDYVGTSCKINGTKYEQYLPLVRLKQDVEEERGSIVQPNPLLNVVLVGIDSVSKLNFLRHFPKTHNFLYEKLKPFEMNGYTKVADNTFPNLVPMLTGRFVDYWWNETVKDTMFFDDIDFIWKEYTKKGYRTFYAEDSPFTGTFNYLKRGFHDPPTDYYFRPLALALERWKILIDEDNEFCVKSQIDSDIIFDYLKDFTQTMEKRPYFGFAMISTITHDDLNYAGWADEPTEQLLEGLFDSGALNNTMLVLFSDHGLRYGEICRTYVGKFEERLPLMYIHIPKWFLDQHPEIDKNMQTNQHRLMTLFDIHATMLHLLDLNKSQTDRSMVTMGRSLFEEIPETRTCDDALIEFHWCPCQISEIVSASNPEVVNASQAMVDEINIKLQPYSGICETLEVDSIMDARVGKANQGVLHYAKTINLVINRTLLGVDGVVPLDDYIITLVTKPGGAIFEGTVRHNTAENSYNVLGLNRISMYGNTSWCIDSQKLKVFCYCKIQQLR